MFRNCTLTVFFHVTISLIVTYQSVVSQKIALTLEGDDKGTLSFECSSYFNEIQEDSTFFTQIRGQLKTKCIEHGNYQFGSVTISNDNIFCSIQVAFNPSVEILKLNKECWNMFNKVILNAPYEYWGYPWGCKENIFEVNFAGFYPVKVHLPALEVSGIKANVIVPVNVTLLEVKENFTASCLVTTFGGYKWTINATKEYFPMSIVHKFKSYLPELVKKKIIDQDWLESLIIFILHSIANNTANDEPNSVKRCQTALYWLTQRQQLYTLKEIEWIRLDLHNLADIIINNIIKQIKDTAFRNNHINLIGAFVCAMTILQSMTDIYWNYFPDTNYFQRTNYFSTFQGNFNKLKSSFTCCQDMHRVELLNGNYEPFVSSCIHASDLLTTARYQSDSFMSSICLFRFRKFQPSFKVKITLTLLYAVNTDYIYCSFKEPLISSKWSNLETHCKKVASFQQENKIQCVCQKSGFYTLRKREVSQLMLSTLHKQTMSRYLSYIYAAMLFSGTVIIWLIIQAFVPKLKQNYALNSRITKQSNCFLFFNICIGFAELLKVAFIVVYSNISFVSTCTVLLGVAQHSMYILSMGLRVAASLTTVMASRSHSLHKFTIQATLLVVVIASVFVICMISNYHHLYNNIACFPNHIFINLKVMNIAATGIELIILLIMYPMLCKPYRYLDEWIGCIILAIFSMLQWSLPAMDEKWWAMHKPIIANDQSVEIKWPTPFEYINNITHVLESRKIAGSSENVEMLVVINIYLYIFICILVCQIVTHSLYHAFFKLFINRYMCIEQRALNKFNRQNKLNWQSQYNKPEEFMIVPKNRLISMHQMGYALDSNEDDEKEIEIKTQKNGSDVSSELNNISEGIINNENDINLSDKKYLNNGDNDKNESILN